MGILCSFPLQYSCLKNFMDRGDWWDTVHGVAKSDMTERLTHTRKSDDIELYCHEKIAYSSVEKTGRKRACLV